MTLDTLSPTLEAIGGTPTILHVASGAVIVIRCHDQNLTPWQIREVAELAQAFFPDNKVLALPDSAIDVLAPADAAHQPNDQPG